MMPVVGRPWAAGQPLLMPSCEAEREVSTRIIDAATMPLYGSTLYDVPNLNRPALFRLSESPKLRIVLS